MPIAKCKSLFHLHGHAKQLIERLAARILKQQHGPVVFVDEF
jgi:hypothetical protein